MSWFNDVKNNIKLKKLAIDEFVSSGKEFYHVPDIADKILGKKSSITLIEYAWRAHIYTLLLNAPSYDMSIYRVFELCTTDTLLTAYMYESAVKDKCDEVIDPSSIVMASFFNWGYSKEVYTFDENIVDAIKDSECKEYDSSIFEKLPFDSFYIDCRVGRWSGALITNYRNNFKNKVITIMMISPDFPNGEVDWYVKAIDYDSSYTIDNCLGHENDIKEYLNLVNFLSCKNAEIVGAEHRYVTDKKTNNKLIRPNTRDYSVKVVFENEKQKDIVYHYLNKDQDIAECGIRSPHIRRAHWGKYWAYKRDINGELIKDAGKEAVYHWIPPIFVNGKTLLGDTIRVF